MRQNDDSPQMQIHWQLLLLVLVGVAVWAGFFLWAPDWALWTIASMLGIGASIALGAGYKRAAGRKKQADETLHRAALQETIDYTKAYCDFNQVAIDEACNNADATARASALRRARRMLSNVDFVGQHDQTLSSADRLITIEDADLRNRLYENLASITPDNKLKIPIDAETPLDLKVLDGLTIEQINSVRHMGENHE